MTEHLKLVAYLLRPKTIFLRRASKGMGDNLLLSLLLPGLRSRHPGHRIVVETEYPELFLHNPHLDWATRRHLRTTSRHLKPRYRILPGERHSIYRQLLDCAGLDGPAAPRLYLLPRELEDARRRIDGDYLCVCPSGKQGFCGNRKEWGLERFQAAIERLSDLRFAQIGAASDPPLAGAVDLRGLPVRVSAAVLANSRGFLGLEGGLMHLAKAVDRPATIVYGGLVSRASSAYEDHVVLAEETPCSPCFSSERAIGDCDTMDCMERILVERVVAGVREMLARQADGGSRSAATA